MDSHGACELMSHFYDVSGEALNWNGLCMCGILRSLWPQMTFIGGAKVIYPKSRMTSPSICPKPSNGANGRKFLQ